MNLNKLDTKVNEVLQEHIRGQITEWKEDAEKWRTFGVFHNDEDSIRWGDEYMKKAQDAVGRLLELQMNPLVSKPLWIE